MPLPANVSRPLPYLVDPVFEFLQSGRWGKGKAAGNLSQTVANRIRMTFAEQGGGDIAIDLFRGD
jgi:hypothetical protein